MCITDSLCSTPETNTTLQINYTPIKILKTPQWSLHILRMDIIKKRNGVKSWRICGEIGTLYTVSWYVNWCSHYGKQYGGY